MSANTVMNVTLRHNEKCLIRHEENGVQDEAMAREMLRLLHLQKSHRNQELHSKGDK